MSQNLSKRAKLKALEGKLNLLKAFGILFGINFVFIKVKILI